MYPITNHKVPDSTVTSDNDELTCICCTEPLTIKNIVNTKCKHQVCSDCYYKWAGDHNSCVFCRQKLYVGARHEEYVKLGRDIQRRQLVANELGEEQTYLENQNARLALRCTAKLMEVDAAKTMIREKAIEYMNAERKLRDAEAFIQQIRLWKKNPTQAIEMWEKEMEVLENEARKVVMKKMRECLNEMSEKRVVVRASNVEIEDIDDDFSSTFAQLFDTGEHPLIVGLDSMSSTINSAIPFWDNNYNQVDEDFNDMPALESDVPYFPSNNLTDYNVINYYDPEGIVIPASTYINDHRLTTRNNRIAQILEDVIAYDIHNRSPRQRREEYNPAELHGGYAHGHG